MRNAAYALGRLLYGGYFAYNGLNHLQNASVMAQYAGSKEVPSPKAAVIGSGVMLLAGGLSVLSGYKPRLGLGLLGTFLVGVSPTMHAFWKVEDPQARMGEQVHFMKNVALLGSALMLTRSEGARASGLLAPPHSTALQHYTRAYAGLAV